jgi:hypothetical protein
MGGSGSGRWGWHFKKTTIEQCATIDASRWTKAGILHEGGTRSGWESFVHYHVNITDVMHPYANLRYDLRSGARLDYPVALQTTQPHYGGLKWWFTCPLVRNGQPCNRRVQKLFLPPRDSHFGCRHCYNFSYASRSHGALDRSRERARGIRLRVGGSASFFDPFPPKPKGMWWKTYERLEDEYAHADRTASARGVRDGARRPVEAETVVKQRAERVRTRTSGSPS